MSKSDLDSLTTKLADSRDYPGDPPAAAGIRGFVCPRANAYGGRHGIIPPAVAVQRGLVPTGMREVKAFSIPVDGMSEEERYKKYYGSTSGSLEPSKHLAPTAPSTDNAPIIKVGGNKDIPSTPDLPTVPDLPDMSDMPDISDISSFGGIYPPIPAPPDTPGEGMPVVPAADNTPVQAAAQGPEAGGVFSQPQEEPQCSKTLDDFYEELKHASHGTVYGTPKCSSGRSTQAGSAGRSTPAEVGPVGWPDSLNKATAELLGSVISATRSAYTDQLQQYKAFLEEYKVKYAEMVGKVKRLTVENKDLTSQLASITSARHETVRMLLGADEYHIDLRGNEWRCDVFGVIHFSHTRSEAILTVGGAMYASDLLSEIRCGDVVMTTDYGRTSCKYTGRCGKIYGDTSSSDFIACFWLENVVSDGGDIA